MSPGESTSKFEQPDDLFKGNWQNKSPPSSQSAMEIKVINEIKEMKEFKQIKAVKVIL